MLFQIIKRQVLGSSWRGHRSASSPSVYHWMLFPFTLSVRLTASIVFCLAPYWPSGDHRSKQSHEEGKGTSQRSYHVIAESFTYHTVFEHVAGDSHGARAETALYWQAYNQLLVWKSQYIGKRGFSWSPWGE